MEFQAHEAAVNRLAFASLSAPNPHLEETEGEKEEVVEEKGQREERVEALPVDENRRSNGNASRTKEERFSAPSPPLRSDLPPKPSIAESRRNDEDEIGERERSKQMSTRPIKGESFVWDEEAQMTFRVSLVKDMKIGLREALQTPVRELHLDLLKGIEEIAQNQRRMETNLVQQIQELKQEIRQLKGSNTMSRSESVRTSERFFLDDFQERVFDGNMS